MQDRFQPANTSVVAHGDKLLALHGQDFPYSLQLQDDGTLRTMQRHNFGGQLRHTFTAHPKLDPATGGAHGHFYECRLDRFAKAFCSAHWESLAGA